MAENVAIRIRKTRPLTVLLSEILSTPIPIELQRLLSGRRADGSRKKGRPRSGTLHALPENATFADALVLALLAKALSGDVQAQKLCFVYIEGLPQRTIAYASTNASTDSTLVIEKLNAMFSPRDALPDHGKTDPAHV